MSELNSEAYPKGLTFEKVWAALMENREQIEKTHQKIREEMKEADLKFKEEMKEADLKFQKQREEAEKQREEDERKFQKQREETNRIVGDLGNSFGELAEHLVRPGIIEKFNKLGFHFTRDCENAKFRDPKTNRPHTEVDILLENGDIVIAVEVKSKLKEPHVDDHLKRMEVLRRMADSKGDKRKYRGAIAGAIVTDEARKYALNAGFYLIEQSGDTMKLDLPEGFVPREW